MVSAERGPRRPAIRTPDQRLRVFVSSTLDELAAERGAARDAIEQLRLAPVMFESGARAHPPQAVYRAYLEQSDVFVGIYWQHYGWVGPGMTISGLEDELRLATDMPQLLYVKVPAPAQEPGLSRMLDGIRAEGATAYKKFTDVGELRELVASDLATMLAEGFGARDRDGLRLAIPSPVTAMVGRDADVKEVAAMLTAPDRRLVVLTGAGGAGKTRLALAVAEQTREQWPDGAAFVDLSAVSDPARVPDAIASALSLVGQGRERPLDTLQRNLAGRDMLIILDNFEQLLDAAPVVADLLQRAPSLHVLVTSRVVLRVRGEQEWRVEPLGVPLPGSPLAEVAESPTVRLFVDRVRALDPGFTVTSQNVEAVAELCRRLDGLPLAVELAAASMRLLTPQEVLARLPQRLEHPGALADLPARQQTLAATIQWSYDLLPESAQRTLARLSVFTAPFTVGAVVAVCGQDGADPIEDLSLLVDHSMVSPAERPDGQRAFRLLDLIRRFAAELVADATETLGGLERYLLDVLEAASPRFGSHEPDMRRLDSEQPNLLSVLSWMAKEGRPRGEMLRALGDVWVWLMVRGHLRESSPVWQQIAALARELGSDEDRTARAWLLAGGWTNQGEFTKAIDTINAALADGYRAEEASRTAGLLMARAVARVHTAHDLVQADFAEALAVARGASNPLIVGYVAAHYGAMLCIDGDKDKARALHEEALTIARSLGDVNLRAEAHYLLAIDSIASGDAESAGPQLAVAVRHYQSLEHFEGLARCLGALSALALQCGQPQLAARLIGTAAAVRDRFELTPWPYVLEAERRTISQVAASLSEGEYPAQVTIGRGLAVDEALTAAQPMLAGRQTAPPADARGTLRTASSGI